MQVDNKTFNHLKVHTQYSICEGAIKIDQLKNFCKKNKIESLGLSDTYNLSGALEFSENLSSVGTQPIIGTQILFKYKEFEGLIPLIAKNNDGYKNIIKLSSKSYLENAETTNPHCKLDDLLNNSDGIIILTGSIKCFFGSLFILFLYAIIVWRIIKIGNVTRSNFGKLFCYGFGSAIFVYVAVNMSMVLGLLPIVGSPLPIMSYGGSSMLATMIGLSIVMSTKIHSKQIIH